MTVNTKERFGIPSLMLSILGIDSSDYIALMLEDWEILLRRVSKRLVDETCGLFAGSTWLADELHKERRG